VSSSLAAQRRRSSLLRHCAAEFSRHRLSDSSFDTDFAKIIHFRYNEIVTFLIANSLSSSSELNMSPAANDILKSIDSLPEPERHSLTVELLRRVLDKDSPTLSDDQLLMAAEELFQQLDAQEAANS
jgi:hypothetical protein